jgi:hypothetical protein
MCRNSQAQQLAACAGEKRMIIGPSVPTYVRTVQQSQPVTRRPREILRVVARNDCLSTRGSKSTRAIVARVPAARRSRREAAVCAKPVPMDPSVRPYGGEEQWLRGEGAKLVNVLSQSLGERNRCTRHRLVALEEKQLAAQTARRWLCPFVRAREKSFRLQGIGRFAPTLGEFFFLSKCLARKARARWQRIGLDERRPK